MKKSKQQIFYDHLKSMDEEKHHAPKGFLQPLYDLVGFRVIMHSSTPSGKKGVEVEVDSVSQNYDEKLGRSSLTLKFKSGSNLSIPIPSAVEVLESGDILVKFERKGVQDDEANPYYHMRKNVKGYTKNRSDGFPEVLIQILEDPKED